MNPLHLAVVITVLNAYSGFALVAEGFMLDNPLLTTVSKSHVSIVVIYSIRALLGGQLDWR